MKIKKAIKKGIAYLQNQEIDLSIRMLFLLEYTVLFASIVGTIVMALTATSIHVLIPNFILLFFCLFGIYFTFTKKKYDLAAVIIICGGDYFALTYMFFTSGGNHSGMPIWLLFGIAFTCMMVKGRLKVIMSSISIAIACICMLLGWFHPELVHPLEDDQAVFIDMFQSFFLVAIILCLSLMLYLKSYDRQREMLEKKSLELEKTINTDALTKISNRHAYYGDTVKYVNGGYKENLVLVTLDINGLKYVNDTNGHAAGDELIRATAEILTLAFSKYGAIYRTGGDEFNGILFCTDEEADLLDDALKAQTAIYNENNNAEVSVAMGIAVWNRNKDMSFFELEKLADSDMYKNKNAYYMESKKDRRKY